MTLVSPVADFFNASRYLRKFRPSYRPAWYQFGSEQTVLEIVTWTFGASTENESVGRKSTVTMMVPWVRFNFVTLPEFCALSNSVNLGARMLFSGRDEESCRFQIEISGAAFGSGKAESLLQGKIDGGGLPVFAGTLELNVALTKT